MTNHTITVTGILFGHRCDRSVTFTYIRPMTEPHWVMDCNAADSTGFGIACGSCSWIYWKLYCTV